MRMTIAAALGALTLAALPPPAAGADKPAGGEEGASARIGYVDFQRALNEVDEGKVAKAALKKDFDDKQKQLDKDKADLERLQAEFEKQAMVMSDEAKRERAMEIERRMREAQGKLMGFQKDLSEREREVTRGIFEKMHALTREIADAERYAYVFDKNAIVHGPAADDLTNELIRKYNARYRPEDKKPAAQKKKEDAKKGDKGEKKEEAKK